MRIALISDLHGNLTAFEAVLADIDAQDVDQTICLGDIAALGPRPVEVTRQLQALVYPAILGNTDAWLLHPEEEAVSDPNKRINQEVELWGARQIGETEKLYLGALPESLEVPLENGRTLLCCHASPAGITAGISADLPDSEIEQRLAGKSPDVLAVGHTHATMWRSFGNTQILNPGSVGLMLRTPAVGGGPRYRPFAEYAILDASGEALSAEFRRIPYDLEAYAQAVRESGMPHGEAWLARFGLEAAG